MGLPTTWACSSPPTWEFSPQTSIGRRAVSLLLKDFLVSSVMVGSKSTMQNLIQWEYYIRLYFSVGAVHEVWWVPGSYYRSWDQHVHEPVAREHQGKRHRHHPQGKQPRAVGQYKTSRVTFILKAYSHTKVDQIANVSAPTYYGTTHYLANSSFNSSRLINRKCELTRKTHSHIRSNSWNRKKNFKCKHHHLLP